MSGGHGVGGSNPPSPKKAFVSLDTGAFFLSGEPQCFSLEKHAGAERPIGRKTRGRSKPSPIRKKHAEGCAFFVVLQRGGFEL